MSTVLLTRDSIDSALEPYRCVDDLEGGVRTRVSEPAVHDLLKFTPIARGDSRTAQLRALLGLPVAVVPGETSFIAIYQASHPIDRIELVPPGRPG